MSRRPLAIVLGVLLGIGLVVPAAADELPNPTDPTAVLDISKSASATEVGPGDTLVYTIEVGCSAISDVGCRDAITTDIVPEPFVIDSVVPSGPNSAGDPQVTGQNVRVDWTEDIGAGAEGMLDSTTSQVEITVHVPDDVSYDFNGVTVTNEALAEATNATDAPASVDVSITVPLDLATSATKAFDPASTLAAAGTPVTASLSGSNDSNATVDTLVIQDPVDPTATPNPFTYLGFTGFGTVTPPDGATGTTYEVDVDGAWVTCADPSCPGVDPATVEGTRVTFTGAIPAEATGSVVLDLETTEEAAAVPDDTTITNTVESEVTLDGEDVTGQASADFTLRANAVLVAATKVFDPDVVNAGESSTVTLGARNTSPFPIDSLTISEPSTGSFPPQYTFGGFPGGIDYPAGATSGTVVYQPSGEEVSFADGATPAPPSGGAASVTSFEIIFTGDIQPGAETSVPFDVDTAPDLDPADPYVTVNNEVAVEGENDGVTGDDTADDDLYIYGLVIEPYVEKQVRPGRIIASPGEIVTVSLRGGTTERPDPTAEPPDPTGTTADADQIVIQDPPDDVAPNPWWNAFDLETIAQTPIPADSTLTVEYYDTTDGEWKVLVGPVEGPDDSFNYDVPEEISEVAGGVRFVYDYVPGPSDGFAPGTDLTPNFTASLRPADDGRYSGPAYNTDPDEANTLLPNCAQSSATSTEADDATSPEACDDIEIVPLDGEGIGDLIDKAYGTASSGGAGSVIARSGDTIPSTLSWSTGGYSGLQRVEITDVPSPGAAPNNDVANTVYDAFDLVRVQPITPEQDPYLTYDAVSSVELWNGSAWVDATNDPCPAACDGTFPGMDLTAAEQESTLAVRLTFIESPTRIDRIQGDLDAPPVGSGVARSIDNDRRLTLTWQVRDTHRSDGSTAALGDLSEAPFSSYNTDEPGLVRNDVNATGYPADGSTPIRDDASDTVVILDRLPTTTTTKDWLGGPVAIPSQGTPEDRYPRTRLRIQTTNTTPARVDQLQITDPAPGSTTDPFSDPFDYFRLVRIAAVTVPTGTETTTVILRCRDDSTLTYTREEALALSPLPCDVTGVQVLFDGRIASGGSGVLALDVQLRAENAETNTPITPDDGPISNAAQGIVADVDPIGDCPPGEDDRYACAQDGATIDIVAPTFGVTAGKSIAPATQVEGDFSPVTVTVSAQNSGSARPYLDTITDDDPTFWNAVDLIRMDPSWTLPEPVEFVQACYLAGGDFTDANVEGDAVEGDWTCQEVPGGGPPFEPGVDLTLDQARDFIDNAPVAEIHGLEFTFMANDEVGWQNPANPLIQVPFQVERREELRTGGPVPTTRSDQAPAPGEDEAGIFVDTVEVEGQSVLVGADTRLEDSDTADAPYTHDHLTVGVEVDKTPSGEVPPGQVIPFELVYTNTGDAPLTNPVFTDVLPSDADGNQLVFDPDSDPAVDSPYSFELTGAAPAPPNGDPLPTDQDDITITESGDTITFEMPEGTVLEPGQTYTITIELVLRPGLTPDDLVTNTDTIIADEPFDPDACSPSYDADTGECFDQTTVSPIRVAALSTVKKVRADVPVDEPGIPEVYLARESLPDGVDLPDDYCDTAADADGFYRAPCVPVTYPGDTETWRFTITNAGTIPLDELVSIDNLPYVGDRGVIVDLPRGTEWPPTFAGGVQLLAGGAGGTLTTFYTTDRQPCTDDLDPLGTGCPDGAWLPYDDTVDAAAVASLKFVIDFPAGDLFDPGEQVSVQFQTRTTPRAPVVEDFPIAWNTVATGGASNDDGTRGTVTATEGREVGVTYPTGPIQLQKTVSGEGAEFAPEEFTVQLTCTVEGEPMTGLPELTLTPGADPTQVDGLPWGAECTATETDQGQAEEVIGTATVGGPEDEIGLVDIDNVFLLGDMSVTKTVTTDAVDQDGDPISYGPFDVEVTCTYLGEAVVADGFEVSPMAFTLSDGETVDLTGLPVGASCTTTEPGSADAVQVDITPPTVEITDTSATEPPVEVGVENVYATGSLRLLKEVTGGALANDPALAEGPFTLHVTCTLTDASHPDGTTVYDADVVLEGQSGEAPEPATIDDLPTGAVCDVEETDAGGATTHTVDPEQVTVGDGTTVEVTATNVFQAGSMTVTKTVETDAVDQDGDPITYGPFEIAVTCTFQGAEVLADGYTSSPMTATIADGETVGFTGLPVGATCTTTETDDADAADVTITPAAPVTIASGPVGVAVSVTNQYTVGSLTLVKLVEGPALDNNPALGAGPFTLHVSCTLTDDSHPDGTTVYDADVVLEGEQPLEETIDDLPTGAVCDITEPVQGGSTSVEIAPDQVTIGTATTVEATATNVFEVGRLAVTKTVTSDAVDQDGDPIGYGPFEVSVTCTLRAQAVVADGFDASPMTFAINEGTTETLTGLPVGAECTTIETRSAGAEEVTITPAQPVVVPEPGPLGQPQTIEVRVDNRYDVGSLRLRKLVAPAAVEQFPISRGPFTLHVVCTLTDATRPDGAVVYEDDVVLQGPQPLEATIDDIAAGAVCTVTEPDDGAATVHLVAPLTVTVLAGRTVTVVATNLFGAGALTVTKTVDGPGAELYGAGPFEVSVSCSYTDSSGQQAPLDTPGGTTRTLTAENDYTATYAPLLFGSTCRIEETATGGATSTVITDADGKEVSQFTVDSLTDEIRVNVANTFAVGSVRVQKRVIGDGPNRFEVELSCTRGVDGDGIAVAVPGGATRALARRNDFTARYDDLPAGAACTLVETDDGGARETTISPNDGDPEVGVATVGDGTTVRLDVVNEFDPALQPDNADADDVANDDEVADEDDDASDVLPDTGAGRALLALALLGLALLGAGGVLVGRGRRARAD